MRKEVFQPGRAESHKIYTTPAAVQGVQGSVAVEGLMQAGLAPLRQVPASGNEQWEPPAAVVQPSERGARASGEAGHQQEAANFEDLARIFAASAEGLAGPGSRSSSPGYSPSEDSRGAADAGALCRVQPGSFAHLLQARSLRQLSIHDLKGRRSRVGPGDHVALPRAQSNGRQRRASAVAAQSKVTSYIADGQKSIRVSLLLLKFCLFRVLEDDEGS